MKSVSIEIGDLEYEIDVTHFQHAVATKDWDPGDGGEIELGNEVKVWAPKPGSMRSAIVQSRIPLEQLLDLYAESEDIDRSQARAALEEYCYENVSEQYADDYDDRKPDYE